ncbi:LysR family transcriptional regulator [Cupriavidus necator]|uniref:LysR family transcriptional regulator n=1 Tax=Cupriavidus necator TaxID=106590 RepID=A0A1U9UN61_CUPNE|nr:LysR family transcriptional regulator [Cupriavidus necator]AQV94019.1 LysR family transcriptional regulator [Cupriavidus necator]
MNLRRLEHLIAVAEEGSLAGAARRVHLTQPALTRSLQTLEDEAGMILCDRGPRGVTLTEAGRMVTERARRILFETHCLSRDLMLALHHDIGTVHLGMGPFPAAVLLPKVLLAMQRDWPGIQLRAEVNGPSSLLAALQAEKLDFIVVEHRTIPLTADLEVRLLEPEISGCFVRPGHPLCLGSATVTMLRSASFASVLLPGYGHESFRKLLRCKPGEQIPFQVESNDFHALIHLATQSDVVLVAPKRAVLNELKCGALVQLSGRDIPDMTTQFAIVRLAQRTLSPAAERGVAAVEAAEKCI